MSIDNPYTPLSRSFSHYTYMDLESIVSDAIGYITTGRIVHISGRDVESAIVAGTIITYILTYHDTNSILKDANIRLNPDSIRRMNVFLNTRRYVASTNEFASV